jgi:hypothetical protein
MVIILVVVGIATPALAQEGQGWSFSGRFSGSSNSAGIVMKADPAVGYTFAHHFETYVGVPFYFVKESSTATTTTTTATNGFMNGIGNAYIGFRLGTENPSVHFSSNLLATAPTGDKSKGFTTGRATLDWTNSFDHKFSSVTPFGNIGLANTVSDTRFFVRPFTSLGFVTHFDGGAKLSLSQYLDLGASVYAVRAAGQQTIFSKIASRGATSTSGSRTKNQILKTSAQTVGTADLTDDDGFSGWLTVLPQSVVDFQIGYTRSAGYDLNTVFFGAGFRFGK